MGTLLPKGPSGVKIEALEVLAEEYRQKALEAEDPTLKAFYKSVELVSLLKADSIRTV